MIDYYRQRLKRALWTWREQRHLSYPSKLRRKDRASGRREKRGARNEEKRDRLAAKQVEPSS